MNEQFEVLQSIYSRPNELTYDEQTQTIVYNAYDDHRQTIAFSLQISSNENIHLQSQILTRNEFKQFQDHITSTNDLFDLFSSSKEFYEHLMAKRPKDVQEKLLIIDLSISIILLEIDHMRSPNVYMKHLRQWTNELNLTGRIWILPHGIYLLIEGKKEQLKKFLIRLKNETVDIDSRGRPCKERLITQLIEYDQPLARFDNFDKVEFTHRADCLEYLTKYHYENLTDHMRILTQDNRSMNKSS